MEFKDFIKQYLLYSKISVSEIVTKASFEFAWAFINDLQCRNWYIRQRYFDLGLDAQDYCCLELASWILEDVTQKEKKHQHPSPEKFVIFWEDFKSYGIQHSTQTHSIHINFCPWCGKRLPEFDYFSQFNREDKP